ncbi:hypothetical protein M758_1G161100 [Ceratodon purpureus]|nr:hypothetical protein M758_1G161100 [Ceratodon purpureus]
MHALMERDYHRHTTSKLESGMGYLSRSWPPGGLSHVLHCLQFMTWFVLGHGDGECGNGMRLRLIGELLELVMMLVVLLVCAFGYGRPWKRSLLASWVCHCPSGVLASVWCVSGSVSGTVGAPQDRHSRWRLWISEFL